MTDDTYRVAGFLHEARICLGNAENALKEPSLPLARARRLIDEVLDDGQFYVSIASNEAWLGCDGMYVDFGTFDETVRGGERLSHYIWPLPDSVAELVDALAEIVALLPDRALAA